MISLPMLMRSKRGEGVEEQPVGPWKSAGLCTDPRCAMAGQPVLSTALPRSLSTADNVQGRQGGTQPDVCRSRRDIARQRSVTGRRATGNAVFPLAGAKSVLFWTMTSSVAILTPTSLGHTILPASVNH
ncbi:hypothetical protein ACOMHN_018461 [Nucella lapillus]